MKLLQIPKILDRRIDIAIELEIADLRVGLSGPEGEIDLVSPNGEIVLVDPVAMDELEQPTVTDLVRPTMSDKRSVSPVPCGKMPGRVWKR